MTLQKDTPSLQFLCVSVDPSFLTALLEKSDLLDISLDTAKTVEDARKKMGRTTYDAYVIDLHVSEKSAIELIHEIRSKERHKFIIAVITGTYLEEAKVAVLKDKGVINYLLQKPITSPQIDEFIQYIAAEFSPSKTSPSTDGLENLKRKYEKAIPEKIAIITQLVRTCQANPSPESVTELKEILHKFGGSAGSYGFKKVSSICKEMDVQISEKLATGNYASTDWLSSLSTFLHEIEVGFKTTTPQETILSSQNLPSPKRTLYVVDSDTKFLEALNLEKEEFSIELLVEADPERAIERLKHIDFNPYAIVSAQTFPNSHITAFDIVKAQKLKFTPHSTLFAIIMDQENIDTRLEAMNKGVSYIFHKPVYADVLLEVISEGLSSTTSPGNFKVLVLDDDIDFCNFVTIVLSEIGIPVKSISDSTELFQALEAYKPQLLLLDLVLPKYDGLHLLKSIRQDVSYDKLIVVIVTISEEPMTRLSAYSAKADDILYKPLDIAILQKRILNLADRYKSVFKPHENGHSLINLKTLITKLNMCLNKPGRYNQYLALFEINNFTDQLLKKGHHTVNSLLTYINKQIEKEFEPSLHNFSYNLSKFALIFDEKDASTIENVMHNFLVNLSKNSPEKDLTFNLSIVPITKKFGNADRILHIADDCLNEANKKDPAVVRSFVLTTENAAPIKKEVVLVDSDEDLLKILKTAFEAHGIGVHTYLEGEAALQAIFAKGADSLPSLIIVERKLIDMDGLDLIIKINDHFNVSIPFYVLSIFSSDKDVSEGLKQGALEYIGKPFNLSILMQKALKSILKD